MIIVKQNKNEIINFDNVMNINIMDCEEEGFLISAGFIVGRDDNYRELGYYKTKERANEVLKGIINAYEKAGNVSFEMQEDNQTVRLTQNSNVFEMPED